MAASSSKGASVGNVYRQPQSNKTYIASEFVSHYKAPADYSFADVKTKIVLPFGQPIDIYGLTLISLSEHRDTYPVTALGRAGIKGMTLGHLLIAGTLAFNVIKQNPFAEAIQAYAHWMGNSANSIWISPTELPPFDLNLIFFNSNADASYLTLRSVKILDSSKNISINDIRLTDVYSFMAASQTTLTDAGTQLNIAPDSDVPTNDDKTLGLGFFSNQAVS
jgi:hypothetical protein